MPESTSTTTPRRNGSTTADKATMARGPDSIELSSLVSATARPSLMATAPAVRPLGNPTVVAIGGITGIFTPVSSGEPGTISDDERQNFQSIITDLQKRVTTLEGANTTLNEQLETLRNPPRSPEDFATALQLSVDEFQQKLAATSNPVSSFALKGFKLEANVFVNVSPLGTVEYRFVGPGDSVDGPAPSRLTLELVPMPKSTTDHTFSAEYFQPNEPVDALPDLGPSKARILQLNQIYTVGELLAVGTRARAAVYLMSLLGVERSQMSNWMKQAMLLTLKGTNGATVLVLIQAGFPDFETLAATTPEALLASYTAARAKQKTKTSLAASLADCQLWVAATRKYLGLPV